MAHDASPTARALLALEAVQNSPGISAQRLGELLGVTERAARRYVAILREADVPIESVTGPYGGYRIGRGLRLAPLMFSPVEALGLVMAILEGHRQAADPADPVGAALAKIIRVLPERLADPLRTLREGSAGVTASEPRPEPRLAARLIEHCVAARRVRLAYRMGGREVPVDFEPWAVVLRHSRWYLLGRRPDRDATRTLRIDRITDLVSLPETFTPPEQLDALKVLEEHMAQGWPLRVEVRIEAPVERVTSWLPRSLGQIEADGPDRTRLLASTEDPHWYARQLAGLPARFRVLGGPELSGAVADLGAALRDSAGSVDAVDAVDASGSADATGSAGTRGSGG
jgi:predicted DNA-binding transcriptional regulator YafY